MEERTKTRPLSCIGTGGSPSDALSMQLSGQDGRRKTPRTYGEGLDGERLFFWSERAEQIGIWSV
ncbi:hypothetical protein EXIGUO8H_450001 [Exiguobacterium sp. 8H]|nr:hypothetical protein EXIGUO8A_320001 [Exiguobacterium sp. 8A]VXC04216.1 hypothetical protein EXIGUO8H_450001 [Exiguobacterium sp. 8H]